MQSPITPQRIVEVILARGDKQGKSA